MDNIFDEYTLQICKTYGIDQGLGSILGKAKVQVSRLAWPIHAAALVFAISDQLINDNLLPGYYDKTKPMFDLLKRVVTDFNNALKWTLVSEVTTKVAVSLLNYFVIQKKIYTNRKLY